MEESPDGWVVFASRNPSACDLQSHSTCSSAALDDDARNEKCNDAALPVGDSVERDARQLRGPAGEPRVGEAALRTPPWLAGVVVAGVLLILDVHLRLRNLQPFCETGHVAAAPGAPWLPATLGFAAVLSALFVAHRRVAELARELAQVRSELDALQDAVSRQVTAAVPEAVAAAVGSCSYLDRNTAYTKVEVDRLLTAALNSLSGSEGPPVLRTSLETSLESSASAG